MNAFCLAIFFSGFWLSFLAAFLYFTHMFQLNSYKPDVQRRWIGGRPAAVFGRVAGILPACLLLFLPGKAGLLAAAVLLLLSAFWGRPKKAKKPLVFTNRVKRLLCTMGILAAAVTLLSLLPGSRLAMGLTLLVVHLLAPFFVLLCNWLNRPVEQAINRHYIREAEGIVASMPSLQVVGITGSYGKTSVKFFLQKLMTAKYETLMTPESFNTTLGVVRTIREQMKGTHEYFLCEMGAKNPGDIKEICDIVKPRFGIITSIGPQHLESFKTLENVVKTKFELVDSLPADGIAFLNCDNEEIQGHPVTVKKVTYGIENQNADYFGYGIKVSRSGSSFSVRCPLGDFPFETRLIGRHNVLNIVGAIAAASTLGVPMADLQIRVRLLESVPHRLQLIKGGNALIIDDAYNSNPSGAKAALETLSAFEGCRILLTPGMVELGEKQEELNFNFGIQAAESCDYVILVGEKQTKPIYDGLVFAGYPEEKITVAPDLSQALQRANSLPTEGKEKIVLLENDLPDNY